MGPPLVTCLALSLRVRSGLIVTQWSPPSVLLNTTFPPRYTVFASRGDTAMGDVQLKRYCRVAGLMSFTPTTIGRMGPRTAFFRLTPERLPVWGMHPTLEA